MRATCIVNITLLDLTTQVAIWRTYYVVPQHVTFSILLLLLS